MYESLEQRLLFSSIELSVLGTYAPPDGASSAEITAYDPRTQRLFVVSVAQEAVDIVDLSNPSQPTLLQSLDLSAMGGPNSVAVNNGIVAVAIGNHNPQLPGTVAFYKTNGQFLSSVTVGALPDMLTFTPDGRKLLVANEGEPNSYNQPDSVDPEGSVSIITVRDGRGNIKKITQADVATATFTAFNSQESALRAAGVRIFGPNATVAQDLEPEYITVADDSRTAWVTLQENNAIAVVDIPSATVVAIHPLGYKDHSLPGNGLDAGERDGAINIVPRPLLGMYQPDAIAYYTAGGQPYLVMANEGDAREYPGYVEATRISASTPLDPVAFPDAATLKTNAHIARLNISTAQGRFESDSDAEYEQLYTFGARSFSIRAPDGTLVYDSGDALEQIIAATYPANFNASHDNTTFDNRSDDKGPEPEGLVTGEIGGRTYVFIGLERIGGVMVYDITNPAAPEFVQYINNRNFANNSGDLGPEGLLFIKAEDSPSGTPLLVLSNEVSGTVTVFSIATPAPQSTTSPAGGYVTAFSDRRITLAASDAGGDAEEEELLVELT